MGRGVVNKRTVNMKNNCVSLNTNQNSQCSGFPVLLY